MSRRHNVFSCGGFANWGVGWLRDRHVPLNVIFGVLSGIALLSALIVLLIKPHGESKSVQRLA